jgi:hypothetical protein
MREKTVSGAAFPSAFANKASARSRSAPELSAVDDSFDPAVTTADERGTATLLRRIKVAFENDKAPKALAGQINKSGRHTSNSIEKAELMCTM